MKYCVEILRDENGDVISRNILFTTDTVVVLPRGKECVVVDGAGTVDYSTKKVSVDGNGELFIEDDNDAIALRVSEDAINLRMKRQNFGRRLIAIMSIRNDLKSLTQQQIEQLMSDYSAINTALLNGTIETAKAMIQAITPDGAITTEADKSALLAEIAANEAALGY